MEDEIAQLRQQLRDKQVRHDEALREAQSLHKKAEERSKEDQRLRQEAEQRSKEAEERSKEDQRQRNEAEERSKEDQRQRNEADERSKEAQSLLQEEQQCRKQAEILASLSQPLKLDAYLEACHALHLKIEAVPDPSLTTRGATTDPTSRIYPRRIIHWDDFETQQDKIWQEVSASKSFTEQRLFPSKHQLDLLGNFVHPISSETALRNVEHNIVEKLVEALVHKAWEDRDIRKNLGLQGTVPFVSHTNLGPSNKIRLAPTQETSEHELQAVAGAPGPMTSVATPVRKLKGKGGTADQSCIHRSSDRQSIPTFAIEYKAPHKLTAKEVVKGLASEIVLDQDIINKEGEGFLFASRSLVAAVITQLFSFMVGRGLQYGYVCTGETFIFLHIPDNPTIVRFAVCVPNTDVQIDGEKWLQKTAVSRVFAFILQALASTTPPQGWQDAAAELDTWTVEFNDMLRSIPESMRKMEEPRDPAYKPPRGRVPPRSPIQTRSCQSKAENNNRRGDDDDEDDADDNEGDDTKALTTSSGTRSSCSKDRGNTSTTASSAGSHGQPSKGSQQQRQAKHQKIQDRPFCTQQCLLGVASGGEKDENCPNIQDHGPSHIGRVEFLQLVRAQLVKDRGPDADCVPLHLSGAVGSLFKVRLSSHGYTLVAKGVESYDLAMLQHENGMYNRVKAIQGNHVPVCLGTIELILPYYYDGGVFEHFMFLSWAGRPLLECHDQIDKAAIVHAITTAFTELHKLNVLHHDGAPRNILYDAVRGRPMIVDLERAELYSQSLGYSKPNGQARGRERRVMRKQGGNPFALELQSVVENVSRLVEMIDAS